MGFSLIESPGKLTELGIGFQVFSLSFAFTLFASSKSLLNVVRADSGKDQVDSESV